MRLSRTARITLARVDPAWSMAIVRRLRDARLGPTEGPCGGTGRRARLKIEFRKECWFDSGQGHHLKTKLLTSQHNNPKMSHWTFRWDSRRSRFGSLLMYPAGVFAISHSASVLRPEGAISSKRMAS